MSKKYKFITICDEYDNGKQEMFSGHPVYRIRNNRSKEQIGILSYYRSWKQYVFSSQPECVFNNSCLRDVLDFLENVIPAERKTEVTCRE